MALSVRARKKIAAAAKKARVSNNARKEAKAKRDLKKIKAWHSDIEETKTSRRKLFERATKSSRKAAEEYINTRAREKLVFSKVKFDYKPSDYAKKFHTAYEDEATKRHIRLRVLIWGIKSGKSQAGAVDFVSYAVTHPREHGWVVAPTIKQTETCEEMMKDLLYSKPGLVVSYNQVKRQMVLFNGFKIEFRTATKPDRLRGPNIHIAWIDEGAFILKESYLEIRKRTAATKGLILITTTPNGKNWLWDEIVATPKRPDMMPAHAPYGEFTHVRTYDSGRSKPIRWVSHRPTWHFPWVDEEELEEQRDGTTKDYFDQEWGALFTARQNATFRQLRNIYTMDPTPIPEVGKKYSIGVDLGRKQDYTAIVVMDADGRICDVTRWQFVGWKATREQIKKISIKWNSSFLVIDAAAMGDVIQSDLRDDGYSVYPVQLNSWRMKADLVQYLQVAIEHKYIHLTDPLAEHSTVDERDMLDELQDYQTVLTSSGRPSYKSPGGKHDDLVMALALANWGKKLGFAGGSLMGNAVSIPQRDRGNPVNRMVKRQRAKPLRRRKTIAGFKSAKPIWRGRRAA